MIWQKIPIIDLRITFITINMLHISKSNASFLDDIKRTSSIAMNRFKTQRRPLFCESEESLKAYLN